MDHHSLSFGFVPECCVTYILIRTAQLKLYEIFA